MTRQLTDAEKRQIEDDIKKEWRSAGINKVDGFHQYSDGTIEEEAPSSNDGTVYGSGREHTEDNAWRLIFNDDKFKSAVKKAIKAKEEETVN